MKLTVFSKNRESHEYSNDCTIGQAFTMIDNYCYDNDCIYGFGDIVLHYNEIIVYIRDPNNNGQNACKFVID